MKKLLLFLLLWALPCSAQWVATPFDKMIESAKLRVDVEYTRGASKLIKIHRVDTYAQFVAEVKAEVARLEAVDAALAQVDTTKPVDTAATPPVPPTQAELDQQAFLVLLRDWQAKKAALGISKTVTQQDVDDAYAAMKTAYIDAYAPFLVGIL